MGLKWPKKKTRNIYQPSVINTSSWLMASWVTTAISSSSSQRKQQICRINLSLKQSTQFSHGYSSAILFSLC